MTPDDDVMQAIREAAESLGCTVDPIAVTNEMRQAAADLLEAAEAAICEASGDVPRALVEFDPQSRRNDNPWSHRQADPLWLLTPAELEMVPDGTVLVSIKGKRVTKGPHRSEVGHPDYIDGDTRFGMLAYGLLDSQLPPRPAR